MGASKSERFNVGEFEPLILDEDERRRMERQTGRKFGGERIQPSAAKWDALIDELVRVMIEREGTK